MFYIYNLSIGIALSLVLCCCILLMSFCSLQNPTLEKLSAYECGFSPFSNARIPFDVHFYLISILFLLFDIEVMFFFPLCVSLSSIRYYGFCCILLFCLILTLGFIYEWFSGVLEWD